jgi:hypothetical protein
MTPLEKARKCFAAGVAELGAGFLAPLRPWGEGFVSPWANFPRSRVRLVVEHGEEGVEKPGGGLFNTFLLTGPGGLLNNPGGFSTLLAAKAGQRKANRNYTFPSRGAWESKRPLWNSGLAR